MSLTTLTVPSQVKLEGNYLRRGEMDLKVRREGPLMLLEETMETHAGGLDAD